MFGEGSTLTLNKSSPDIHVMIANAHIMAVTLCDFARCGFIPSTRRERHIAEINPTGKGREGGRRRSEGGGAKEGSEAGGEREGEGRREGGREGRREGGREGRREGEGDKISQASKEQTCQQRRARYYTHAH